jgi:hypothetical protein
MPRIYHKEPPAIDRSQVKPPPPAMEIKRTPKNDMEADLMFEFYHRKLGKHKGD